MPKRVPGQPSAKAASKRTSSRASTAGAKSVVTVTAKPAKRQNTAKKDAQPKKNRLVRDSFTMPKSEYSLLAAIKKRCIAQGLAVKKSEVLRAAVCGFACQSDDFIKAAIGALEVIKTGRPPKGKK